jgi:hypothetical protein
MLLVGVTLIITSVKSTATFVTLLQHYIGQLPGIFVAFGVNRRGLGPVQSHLVRCDEEIVNGRGRGRDINDGGEKCCVVLTPKTNNKKINQGF